ncbi:MAG TPA: choice-of-anchor tandem repeat GloVer-containing protein [Alphaproteobacteria bacterium]|nr:choice-of-anchor tandem repeat GloVer-containing protein [Alphaproteobacteria bacterium]
MRTAIIGVAVILGGLAGGVQPATAASETIVHAFTGPPDAINPTTGLAEGPDGFFYGTTNHGGTGGYGIKSGAIYQLKPPTVGHPAWTYSVIWNFKGGANGSWPNGPLVFAADGTGYGVALQGGDTTDCNQGCGVAYSIVPPAPGKKLGVYRVIHKFHSAAGSSPIGALTFDGAGNLYGSTMYGGGDNYCTGDKGGCGVIFRLNKPAMGKLAWPQTTLYRFQHALGAVPNGGLVFDATENALFGTAQGGGTSPLDGVVFRLSKPAPGHAAWGYTVLHNFTGKDHADGSDPTAGLTFDSSGNLYGTTQYGGSTNCNNGCGIVFKLDSGTLSYSIVRTFTDQPDGRGPISGLVYDGTALYGTTEYGGSSTCGIGCGTVYKITLSPSVSYSQLNKFVNNGGSIDPQFGPLVKMDANTLLGTAQAGGGPFDGTVYSLAVP